MPSQTMEEVLNVLKPMVIYAGDSVALREGS